MDHAKIHSFGAKTTRRKRHQGRCPITTKHSPITVTSNSIWVSVTGLSAATNNT